MTDGLPPERPEKGEPLRRRMQAALAENAQYAKGRRLLSRLFWTWPAAMWLDWLLLFAFGALRQASPTVIAQCFWGLTMPPFVSWQIWRGYPKLAIFPALSGGFGAMIWLVGNGGTGWRVWGNVGLQAAVFVAAAALLAHPAIRSYCRWLRALRKAAAKNSKL